MSYSGSPAIDRIFFYGIYKRPIGRDVVARHILRQRRYRAVCHVYKVQTASDVVNEQAVPSSLSRMPPNHVRQSKHLNQRAIRRDIQANPLATGNRQLRIVCH